MQLHKSSLQGRLHSLNKASSRRAEFVQLIQTRRARASSRTKM
uniref:Uncharacterized protein n=1 Tax=Arundo donax TaxID=35708 RepID=A0A0A9B6S9_ARUDO